MAYFVSVFVTSPGFEPPQEVTEFLIVAFFFIFIFSDILIITGIVLIGVPKLLI